MAQSGNFFPDKWVDNYADELYRYTVVRVTDTGFAEDIVQETFLSAWRSRDNFKNNASEKNWLYAICKNKIIDHFRKQPRDATKPNPDEENIYFDEVDHWRKGTSPEVWKVNNRQPVESKEFYSILEKCKQKLKNIQQMVFVMKYLEEMDSESICVELNISPANYWVLIHRCKLHLRSCLEKNWIHTK